MDQRGKGEEIVSGQAVANVKGRADPKQAAQKKIRMLSKMLLQRVARIGVAVKA